MSKMKTELKDLRALVVDDSQVQRAHVVSMCEFYGLTEIEEAGNGEEAITLLQAQNFDLAFIDLEMPVMDGVTLVREIAAKNLLESIIILSSKDPILILSIGTMAESDGLSVLGTFKKPLQTSYLHSSLKKLIESGEQGTEKDADFTISPEELASAIKSDEIEVYFQPKLRTESLVLSGVEVLVRWNHPQHGIVDPNKFIPISERFGFIDELTYKIFHLALTKFQSWRKHGANFNMSLNLSPLSLNEAGIADRIIDLISQYQIDPQDIILEVTENAIAEQVAQSIEMLARLRLQGFLISIDDFGIGYASIQQLSRVPANELKIDRSLVNNIASRPQQQAILTNILNMASDLGLKTVVEGVETEEDFEFLRERHIDLMQGYLISRPLSGAAFEKWWREDLAPLRRRLSPKS